MRNTVSSPLEKKRDNNIPRNEKNGETYVINFKISGTSQTPRHVYCLVYCYFFCRRESHTSSAFSKKVKYKSYWLFHNYLCIQSTRKFIPLNSFSWKKKHWQTNLWRDDTFGKMLPPHSLKKVIWKSFRKATCRKHSLLTRPHSREKLSICL
jgi:hypothetical protein